MQNVVFGNEKYVLLLQYGWAEQVTVNGVTQGIFLIPWSEPHRATTSMRVHYHWIPSDSRTVALVMLTASQGLDIISSFVYLLKLLAWWLLGRYEDINVMINYIMRDFVGMMKVLSAHWLTPLFTAVACFHLQILSLHRFSLLQIGVSVDLVIQN